MASIMLPQDTVVPDGTLGTQAAPPGTGEVPSSAVMAASPFVVRVLLMSAAAAAKFCFRMCPSA
jgi:hypothetical protein